MDVKLPNLGEGADSGTVVNLLVKAGDTVTAGQGLLELESEKAVATIPAPAGGVVGQVFVKLGDKVSVGQRLLAIGETGSVAPAPAAAPRPRPTRSPRSLPRRRCRCAAQKRVASCPHPPRPLFARSGSQSSVAPDLGASPLPRRSPVPAKPPPASVPAAIPVPQPGALAVGCGSRAQHLAGFHRRTETG